MTASRPSRIRARATWLLVVAIGVAVLVAISLSSGGPSQDLDPGSAGPSGGKALVQALRHHGVDVQVVRSAQALADAAPSAGVTVVMANPEYLGYDSAVRMGATTAHADRLVLLSPSSDQLTALGLGLVSAPAPPADGSAGCSSPIARTDDTVDTSDVRFVRPDSARGPAPQLCFVLADPSWHGTPRPDPTYGALMATIPATSDHAEVVALGFASAFTNLFVTQASHAGLAVRALGHSPRLLWYQPGIDDLVNTSGRATPSPWPPWLAPGAAVLAIAAVVLAVVRGRRMGSLVAEPLPVVVRAVETTESRGRLYRRACDRGRAATILRAATTGRLARRLAVPPGDVADVVRAAASASGMPMTHVAALLTGPPPTTDVELHTVASSLTELEERVRTS